MKARYTSRSSSPNLMISAQEHLRKGNHITYQLEHIVFPSINENPVIDDLYGGHTINHKKESNKKINHPRM